MVTKIYNEKYSVWNYPGREFNIARKCWSSNISYNSEGIRGDNIKKNKTKIRVALLGDSMIENLQLSDEEDVSAKLQNLLGKHYLVINFGTSSTGIYDHINIAKDFFLKKKIDIVIYHPDTTDITDNYRTRARQNQNMFDLDSAGKLIKINNQEWQKNYFSKYNIFKRKYFYYIKKYSNSYKLYWELYELNFEYRNKNKLNNLTLLKEDEIKAKKIYKKFSEELTNFFKNNKINFLIIPSIKTREFKDSSERKFFSRVYTENYFDVLDEAKKYLIGLDKYKFPYLGWKCDAHYSYLGADFFSKKFFKLIKSNKY